MKDLILAYSPYGNGTSIFPFDEVFTYAQNAATCGFDNADAFILWGGTDIHPSFYNQSAHSLNGAPHLPSERDMWEWKAMKHCRANNIPIIGVCRGAQFLCVFAGGSLVQHVTGHESGNHSVITSKGGCYSVTSSHHQMLDVSGSKHELLAWTPAPLSKVYAGEQGVAPHIRQQIERGTFKEPEIVYFPDVNGLAIQGHPEWVVNREDTFVKECNQYIIDLLLTRHVWR
jgi:GMP synthase-like glutamine amidotransferase